MAPPTTIHALHTTLGWGMSVKRFTRPRRRWLHGVRCSQLRGGSHPMTTVLVTGCSSGFGDKIARTLASHGHHVYASMRDVQHRNSSPAKQLADWAASAQHPLHVVDLDVTDDAS